VKTARSGSGWRQEAERLDQVLALPMLVLTVGFSAVLVLPVIFPDLPAGSQSAPEAIDLGIWTVFLAEYLARLFVAPDRLAFVRRSGEPRDYVRPGNEPRDPSTATT
jgi:voltage-gated potassium channel